MQEKGGNGMKINILKIPFGWQTISKQYRGDFNIEEKGFIESDNFNREELWHLCNWSCWTEEKPSNLFSELDVANSDVIFHNTEDNTYHLTTPSGWKEFNSLVDCVNYLM